MIGDWRDRDPSSKVPPVDNVQSSVPFVSAPLLAYYLSSIAATIKLELGPHILDSAISISTPREGRGTLARIRTLKRGYSMRY